MSVVFLGHRAPAHAALLQALDSWAARGWLRPLDVAFARFLSAHAPQADARALLAAALASQQLGRGHVALDLHAALHESGAQRLLLPPDAGARMFWPEGVDSPARWLDGLTVDAWAALLRASPLVADAQEEAKDIAQAEVKPADATRATATPLVLDGAQLGLRRYWQYGQQVQRGIAQRLTPGATETSEAPDAADNAATALGEALSALFPDAVAGGCDWQLVACALMARQRFGIVTGGPGTGKTTTVVRLLAALQHVALRSGRPALRIRLAAPTGKAAARLNESIAGAVARLPLQRLSGGAALVNASGTLAPGNSIGTLNFASSLTLAGTSLFEINKTGLTLESDLANVATGVLTLGGSLTVSHDIDAAYAGADVVYAKSWGALPYFGNWGPEKPIRDQYQHFIVDERKMALTNNAVFSHCLPLRRNVKATDAVMDAPYCIAVNEAENRLHVQKAVMATLMRGR